MEQLLGGSEARIRFSEIMRIKELGGSQKHKKQGITSVRRMNNFSPHCLEP